MTPSRCRVQAAPDDGDVTPQVLAPAHSQSSRHPTKIASRDHTRGTNVVFIARGGTLLTPLAPGMWRVWLDGDPAQSSPSPSLVPITPRAGQGPQVVLGHCRLCPVSSASPLAQQYFGEQKAQPTSPNLPRMRNTPVHPRTPTTASHLLDRRWARAGTPGAMHKPRPAKEDPLREGGCAEVTPRGVAPCLGSTPPPQAPRHTW